MRYLPQTDADRSAMLAAIGVDSVDELYRDVPRAARLTRPLDLPGHAGEVKVERDLQALAARNVPAGSVPCFLGAGAYRHHLPAALDHLIQRGEFLTAYTPYQPEVSQGTLQTLFEFQTQVALLTGMEVANASLYDAASACAEAALMAARLTRRNRIVVSGALHPQYRSVTETHAHYVDLTVEAGKPNPWQAEDLTGEPDKDTACVIVQYPDFFGRLDDFTALAEACHAAGALLVVAVPEPVALGAVQSPGDMGADIVVGEGQPLGNPLAFGGPGLGLFATRKKFVRQMPGRVPGQTVDEDGRRGYVLTLSTREQHIRREKATSNICTNSGLCALGFSIHVSLLGEAGLQRLAAINHARAVRTADALDGLEDVNVLNESFFNEFAVSLPRPAAEVVETLAGMDVLGGVPVSRFIRGDPQLDHVMLVAATETTTDDDLTALTVALKEAV